MAANFCWMRPIDGQRIPGNAVHVGVDEQGNSIYVGRAFHGGEILPGEVLSNKNLCYVTLRNTQFEKCEYEILCADHYSWVPGKDGSVPPNAVPAGKTSTNEVLYVGRTTKTAPYKACGKVYSSLGRLYVPYCGKEVFFTEYEVLV